MLSFDQISTINSSSQNNEDNSLDNTITCSNDSTSQSPSSSYPFLITTSKVLLFYLLSIQSLLYSLSSFTSISSMNIFNFLLLNHWILFLSLIISFSFILTSSLHTSLKKDSYSKNTLILLFSLSNSYWIAYLSGHIHSLLIPLIFLSIGLISGVTALYIKLLKEKATSLILWVIYQGIVIITFLSLMFYAYWLIKPKENPSSIILSISIPIMLMISQLPLTCFYYRKIILSENLIKGALMENMLKVYLMQI